MADEEVPVLIVGGSLVGLSAAVFLGHHGIPSLVLERHAGTAIHPRAAAVTQRTMENYRAVGLEPEIEQIAETEFVQNGAIMAVESLRGKELDWYFRFVNEGVEEISPSRRIFVTQIGLEPALSRAAAELGAEIRHGTEARIEAQDADAVTVVLRPRDGGAERTVRARYVVAADGAHSPIRQQLGIRNLGHGSFSDCITIYFRADVRGLMGDRNLSVVYVLHPLLQGFFRFSIDLQSGFLAVFSTVDENGERSPRVGEDMSAETCIAYVRDALGDPDIAVEIESVQRWAATAEYAERLREGRVFLAGDSAHVMPPTGGFGGNCGVQDGYDLAWKLAYVLDGRAGEMLLDTYDAERQPVGALTTEQAYTRYVLRVDPSLGQDNLMPVVHEVPIELGYRYRSAAIVGADDDDTMWEDSREPSGRPGFRAPHAWIEVGGKTRSTLDLFGRNFVVVVGPGGEAWRAAANRAGGALGVGIDVHHAAGVVPSLYGTGDDGAALVRPDGFVAWRTSTAGDDCEATLAEVLATALGRAATRV
jgi:2-polyprenyl-6-methoxyphenol hydroxylase-like FAD-dependent oxidoreductase